MNRKLSVALVLLLTQLYFVSAASAVKEIQAPRFFKWVSQSVAYPR